MCTVTVPSAKDKARSVAKMRIKAMRVRLVGLVAAKAKAKGQAKAELQQDIDELCININNWVKVWA